MTDIEGRSLADLRAAFARLPPPVVVFNKSHSGSRLVARLLEASGVFMGASLNESRDAVSVMKLVDYLVQHYYPDFGRLWQPDAPIDSALVGLVDGVFTEHLRGRGERPWGWKLCETAYALPLIDYLFPEARYIHVIRDGRDVAFSDHVAPATPFWQKIYVDTVGVRRWRGLLFGALGPVGYQLDSSLYNLQHWVNSVELGRRQGAMLRERYLEVRYEELCRDFAEEARHLLQFAAAPDPQVAIDALAPTVTTSSIGKFRRRHWWRVARVKRYARPLLRSLNYLD